MPAAPKWLGPLARAEWRRIAPELHALGLLTRIDRAALVAYCCAWETFVQVEQQLAGGVPLVQMTTGGEAPCALLRVRALATKQLRDFLLEFGLTPAARTRIQVNPDSVADDDESTAQRLIGG